MYFFFLLYSFLIILNNNNNKTNNTKKNYHRNNKKKIIYKEKKKMNQFKKFYIIALMVIVYSAQESYARKRVIFRRDASNSCRKAYLIARTTEKLCHMDITSLDGYSNDVLSDMCSNSGCMKYVFSILIIS